MTYDVPSCFKLFKHPIAKIEPFVKDLIAADCKGEVLTRLGLFRFSDEIHIQFLTMVCDQNCATFCAIKCSLNTLLDKV